MKLKLPDELGGATFDPIGLGFLFGLVVAYLLVLVVP